MQALGAAGLAVGLALPALLLGAYATGAMLKSALKTFINVSLVLGVSWKRCIRDRAALVLVEPYVVWIALGVHELGLMLELADDSIHIAVSYTHLDVYKRQLRYRAMERRLRNCPTDKRTSRQLVTSPW